MRLPCNARNSFPFCRGMKVTRRSFLKSFGMTLAGLAFPTTSPLEAFSRRSASQATIEVRTTEPLGPPIDRALFGKFTEHLGRNVYGGAWAQALENPGFEPEERWGNPAELRRRLRHTEAFVQLPGLAEAPGLGVAPWWAPLNAGEAEYHLRPQGINGTCQELIVHEPPSGMQTFAFLPVHRVRSYQLSLWVRNLGPQENALSVSLKRPRDGTVIATVRRPLAPGDWRNLELALNIASSVGVARGEVLHLSLALERPGTVWLDQCLLFPADHVEGWDPEVVAYMREARLPLLRFPGGNFASGYHWQDGIGPLDSRPAEPNPAWFGVEWNHVGTDEWLKLCELMGTEPLICVNAGDGTPEEAAAWVEYCNGGVHTPMGRLRAENGHPEPYGVKRWEIGNELYGSWQIGHTDAQGYAERYGEFHRAMSAVDPDLEFIACGHDAHWNRTVVQHNPTTVRSFSVHTLSGSHIPREADPLEVYLELMGFLESYPEELKSRAAPMAELGISPKLAITELQIFTNKAELPNNKTLTEAIWTAGIYNLAIRSKGTIELVTHSALVNHGGGLEKRFGVVYADPVWWTTHLYSTMSGTQPVAVLVTGPGFSTEGRWLSPVEDAPYLDAVALLDAAGDELTLLIVNRHPQSALAARIRLQDFSPAEEALISILSGESFMARNSWQDPKAVSIEEELIPASASFDYELLPHSLTVVRLKEAR